MDNLKTLIQKHAIIRAATGRVFNLSSGGTSDLLIDLSKVLRINLGYRSLTREIWNNCQRFTGNKKINAVGGPLSGSDPVSFACMETLNIEKCFGVRKESKRRGFDIDEITGNLEIKDNVLLVEDVCTTGGNLLRVAKIIQNFGANIKCVLTVVDRGGLINVEKALNVPCKSLFTLEDLI